MKFTPVTLFPSTAKLDTWLCAGRCKGRRGGLAFGTWEATKTRGASGTRRDRGRYQAFA